MTENTRTGPPRPQRPPPIAFPPVPTTRPAIRLPDGSTPPQPPEPPKPPSRTPEQLAAKLEREQKYQDAIRAQDKARRKLYQARYYAKKKGLPLPPLRTPPTAPFRLPTLAEELEWEDNLPF